MRIEKKFDSASHSVDQGRRRFLINTAAAGAGLAVGVHIPFGQAAQSSPDGGREVNAWVVIAPDDTVTIRIARSEMGQGALTGLAQLCAEELECDWDKVTWEFPTPGQNLARQRVWGSFSTGGSRGIRDSHQYVREGGAMARHLLLAAAAKAWGVAAEECEASQSVITHTPTGRTLRYGEVATAAATLTAPESVALKDPSEWRVIGQPVKRLDTADKVNGKLRYGADLKLPNMLLAAVHACPVHGGKRKSFDAAEASKMPGVRKVVAVGDDAVGVIADTWWQAKQAIDKVVVEWDAAPSDSVSSDTIDAMLRAGLDAEEGNIFVGNERGAAADAISNADGLFTREYSYPFQNHAPMEPMNATVVWKKDRCEAWIPTQDGESSLDAVASAAGLFKEECEVHKLILGGGFGRRFMPDFITQAVQIAKEMPGTPIKLLWSREEDQRRGYYHPVTRSRFRAKLNAEGFPEALHIRISGQSILDSLRAPLGEKKLDPAVFQSLAEEGDHAFAYGIGNLLIDHAMRNTHLRPGFWRGVNINQNVFYVESFIEELADNASIDRLEYRRKLLADNPKALAVLNKVAEKGGWGRSVPPGRGLGLAVCKAFGSYVAACAEVSVSDGTLKMHKIWAATDTGYAVNPQQIEAQVAGSFVYGLGAALHSEMTVSQGRVIQENFDTYRALKLAEMPTVETDIMPSGGFWGGVGEPTIAVAAPAVLNAIAQASGKRIRDLPLKNQLKA